jgi:membrane-anchored mycosin MYCP
VLAVTVPVGPFVGPAAAAPSNLYCSQPPEPAPSPGATPWPQAVLGPDRAWPFSRGGGVTVALIDSGVDKSHPQLSGHVLPGVDAVAGGPADTDCAGTGTQAAGVIVAQQRPRIGFHGIAPDATILPIRVFEDGQGADQPVPGAVLANAINSAVGQGADVLSISVGTSGDDPAVKAAVQHAEDQDVLVVAAVADLGNNQAPFYSDYPARYDGVVAVGGLDPTGARSASSGSGSYLDLVAPAVDVVTTQIGKVLAAGNGNRLAAAYVAGTAALVRARFPNMSAADVVHRLTATAVAAPGGTERQFYGRGLVNPYGAVTETVTNAKPAAVPGLPPRSVDPVRVAHEAAWARGYRLAWWLTGAAVALALGILLFAVAVPRGRRRHWHSAIAPSPPQPADEEPSPPVLLFEDQQQLQQR